MASHKNSSEMLNFLVLILNNNKGLHNNSIIDRLQRKEEEAQKARPPTEHKTMERIEAKEIFLQINEFLDSPFV